MEALGGEEVYLLLIHYMRVSVQLHAPAALYSPAMDPRYPLYRRLDGPQSRSGQRG
jgi:hypothetical protein